MSHPLRPKTPKLRRSPEHGPDELAVHHRLANGETKEPPAPRIQVTGSFAKVLLEDA
jgi:hypothetical protein